MNSVFWFNAFEIGLWGLCSAGLAWAARRAAGRARRRCLVGMIGFALFAASDAIELRTGAWWRPWPLLLLKATCVVILLFVYADHAAERRRSAAADEVEEDAP